MIKSFAGVCFLCLVLITPAIANAGSRDLQILLDRIRAKASQVKTIESRFKQVKRLEMFEETLVSTGWFAFQSPDKLVWEYETPRIMGFKLAGKDMLVRAGKDGSMRQANDSGFKMLAKQILAWTSFDLAWLKARYDIFLEQAAPPIFILKPKSKALSEIMAGLRVSFAADEQKIQSVEFMEQDGDSTLIRFFETRINHPLRVDFF